MAAGKKKKDKKIIQIGKIATPKKKVVLSENPLATLDKTNPEHENIIVVESSVLDQNDTYIDIENNLITPANSDSLEHFSGIDDTTAEQLPLDIPSNIFIDTINIKKYASPDGTQRISLNVNFDEVLRATDYEVRIASL